MPFAFTNIFEITGCLKDLCAYECSTEKGCDICNKSVGLISCVLEMSLFILTTLLQSGLQQLSDPMLYQCCFEAECCGTVCKSHQHSANQTTAVQKTRALISAQSLSSSSRYKWAGTFLTAKGLLVEKQAKIITLTTRYLIYGMKCLPLTGQSGHCSDIGGRPPVDGVAITMGCP